MQIQILPPDNSYKKKLAWSTKLKIHQQCQKSFIFNPNREEKEGDDIQVHDLS